MINFKIKNNEELDKWLFEQCVVNEYVCDGIKGRPEGWKDDHEINIAYQCRETGELFKIEYVRI